MKVLVAEDSSLLRTQIICLLSELPGIDIVGKAQGALEACEAVQQSMPDVVILDIFMSGGNRIEAVEKIRRLDTSALIIVLTQKTSPPYRQRSIDAGADYFLDKSTQFGELRDIIRKHLSAFEARLAGTPEGTSCE